METNTAQEIKKNGWNPGSLSKTSFVPGSLVPSITPTPPKEDSSRRYGELSTNLTGELSKSIEYDMPPVLEAPRTRTSTPPPFKLNPVVLYLGNVWKTENGELIPSDPKGVYETENAMRSLEESCDITNSGISSVMYPTDIAEYITHLDNSRRSVKMVIAETRGIDEKSLSKVVELAEKRNIPLVFYTEKPETVAPWAKKGYMVKEKGKPDELAELTNEAVRNYHNH